MDFDYSNYSFEKSPCKKKIGSLLKFTLISRLGRFLSRKRVLPRGTLLHLGCGSQILEGFENIDFFSTNPFRAEYRGVDLRFPLPYADCEFEGVFSQHTIEHLYPDQAIALFSEIYRVLKPGAIFRCTVPDLGVAVKFYSSSKSERELLFPELSQVHVNGCECIWDVCSNWDHLSCWDYEMLSLQLAKVGFSEIKQLEYLKGSDRRLLKDTENRRLGTLFVEAKK